jgi:sialic acid synthase SpsE
MGACVVEKHFTLDKKMPGPDHSSSFEPAEFADMARGVRAIEKALGSPVKAPTAAEAKNTVGMRRSIVALQNIPAGSVIQREQLAFKRPATGLKPNQLAEIVGKKALKEILADTPITADQIDW